MINKFNTIPLTPTLVRKRFRSSENSRSGLHESANNNVSKNVSKYANDCVNINNESKISREPGEVNFCGLSAPTSQVEKVAKFHTSNGVKKALEFADKSQLVFSEAFALVLTGLFRPAAIMTLPGQKKNKDDKKYASAHSIASGVIGYALANVLFTPLSRSVKRLSKNPEKFINKNSYLLKDKEAFTTAAMYLDRFPDIAFAIPKGLLTVALIPPILKHVFGWQKKSSGADKKESLIVANPPLNFKNNNDKNIGGLK